MLLLFIPNANTHTWWILIESEWEKEFVTRKQFMDHVLCTQAYLKLQNIFSLVLLFALGVRIIFIFNLDKFFFVFFFREWKYNWFAGEWKGIKTKKNKKWIVMWNESRSYIHTHMLTDTRNSIFRIWNKKKRKLGE